MLIFIKSETSKVKAMQVSQPNQKVIPLSLQIKQILTQEWALVIVLFLLVLGSRLPFQSKILYHWDSVNFAYAIHEFNIAKEQPHPPGYIGYVWLSQIIDSVTHNAQTTLVTISIITSTLAVISLFYLGRAIFDRSIGLIAASLLATSPLFWFYSEIALPHPLDTLLVIVSVWWFYKTMKGHHRYLYPAIIILAIAGGVRQQTLIFLAPLGLFALRRVGWKHFFLSGVVGVVICLLWFIPLITLNGGLSNYLHLMNEFGSRFQDTTSIFMGAGWPGLRRNILKLTLYTLYGWSLALLPALAYAAIRFYRQEWPRHWEKIIFLSLWVAPALFFYTLIHMGQQGLVFVFLPALLLVSAYSLKQLLWARPYGLAGAATALITINIAIFCLLPEYPLGSQTQRFLTRDTLTNSDHYFQERFKIIQENFKPESTIILASNSHHVEYYLPAYHNISFSIVSKWELNEGQAENNPDLKFIATPAQLDLQLNEKGVATIVLFDPDLANFNSSEEMVKQASLPGGGSLEYLELKANSQFFVSPTSFGLSAEQ
jgi:hypothetical protein